ASAWAAPPSLSGAMFGGENKARTIASLVRSSRTETASGPVRTVVNGMTVSSDLPLPCFADELRPSSPLEEVRYWLVPFAGNIDNGKQRALARAAEILDTIGHGHLVKTRGGPPDVGGVPGAAAPIPWTPCLKASSSDLEQGEKDAADPVYTASVDILVYPHRDQKASDLLAQVLNDAALSGLGQWVIADSNAVRGTGILRLSITAKERSAVRKAFLDLARQPWVFSLEREIPPELQNSWNRVYVQGGIPPFALQQTSSAPYENLPFTLFPSVGRAPVAGDTTGVASYPIHARGLLGRGQVVALADSGLESLNFFQ